MEKEVYKGQILRVTEEQIDNVLWERAYVPDGVIVFPMTDEGKIILIKEKRPHETPSVRIKPVSGILEYELGTPEENAQREMQEEIGLRGNKLELLWEQKSTGTINSTQYFFIATGLVPDKLPNPDGEEIILALVEYTPQELLQAIMTQELRWSQSTLGLFRLLQHLGIIR